MCKLPQQNIWDYNKSLNIYSKTNKFRHPKAITLKDNTHMALVYSHQRQLHPHLWKWNRLLQSHSNDVVETNPKAVRQKANGGFFTHLAVCWVNLWSRSGVWTCQQDHRDTKRDTMTNVVSPQMSVSNANGCHEFPSQAIKCHRELVAWSRGVNVNESNQ